MYIMTPEEFCSNTKEPHFCYYNRSYFCEYHALPCLRCHRDIQSAEPQEIYEDEDDWVLALIPLFCPFCETEQWLESYR